MKYGQIPFPAVSFCNLNPFRLDKLPPDQLLSVGSHIMKDVYVAQQKSGKTAGLHCRTAGFNHYRLLRNYT